ncbi:MAG TPA: mannitol dehydrogenase family protein [Bacteroidales bacterium]|nr:mannitol dehydrogenase family protein [Bacteroidales bacterium]
MKIIKLNSAALKHLPGEVIVPAYDRSEIKTGIIHFGPGAFHRAHQAYYTDKILQKDGMKGWGICDVGLLHSDKKIINTLKDQDGLYTLLTAEHDGSLKARITGSIVGYIFAPENPGAVTDKIAGPDTRLITLTITEGGYNFDSNTGDFRMNEPLIQWDLSHPDEPRTVFGYLTWGLKLRKDKGIQGLTIQSCDNIQKNGNLLKKMLLEFVREAEPALEDWICEHVTFPNSMVDRITPRTTQTDIDRLKSVYGIEDKWPVVCEPFIQWITEDKYSNGRPEWESVGVKFVNDVAPYEKMKIRLLNAGHSLLGFTGALYGYTYIHETVHDQLFAALLRKFMDTEVTPVLDEVPDIDLDKYKDSLIERFGNHNIRDQVARICLQSSAKIPKFLIPTIRDQLSAGGPVMISALITAAWCRFAEGIDEPGKRYEVEDDMKDILIEKAFLSRRDNLAFLRIESIFGDLIRSEPFTEAYTFSLNSIYNKGIAETIKNILKTTK